jgi:hypothetical protein
VKKSTKKTTPRVVSTKPLPAVGSQVAESALVGGIGNRKGAVDYKKGK